MAGDFFEQLNAGKFMLSPEMLDWMANNDEAAAVAKEFVKAPRKANRIFRTPKSKHAQLLTEMANPGKTTSVQAKNRGGTKTVVKPLNGRQSAVQSNNLANAKNFEEYSKMRSQM